MPAPKAVLCDLADLGLDPKKHHRRTATDGRLSQASTNLPVETTPPKEALKQLAKPVVAAVTAPPVTPKAVEKKPDPAKVEPPKNKEKVQPEAVKAAPVTEEKAAVVKPVKLDKPEATTAVETAAEPKKD